MSEFLTHSVKSAALTDEFGNKMFFDKVDNFRINFDPDGTNEIVFEGACMRIEGPDKDFMEGLAKKKEETPLTMPTAEVAREVTKVIQEDQRNKAIMEEWERLTKLICAAIKQGSEWITVRTLYDDNKNRLEQMGYRVVKESTTYNWRITWIEPEFQF